MQGTKADTTDALSADDRLVLSAQSDRRYFGALYDKYFESVVRFAYQRSNTKSEAMDIAQQVFMQAMIALDKYEPRGFSFSSWLYRIALNEINTRYRKGKKERTINVDDTALRSVMAEINEPDVSDKEDALLLAMQQLAEEEVQLIEMRFFEKRPFKEIAEIKDTTESAVKMKTYRLLEKMKTIIEKK